MTRGWWFATLVATCGAAGCGSAPPPAALPHNTADSTPPDAVIGIPAEVTALVDRWTTCWHFAGEEATSPGRAKEIADGEQRWCPGNDGERARLTAKYRDRADVQDALRKLDDMR